MAVSHSAFSASHAEQALRFIGKSTDAKPGEPGCKYPAPPNASIFYEMDGDNRFWMYDAEDQEWVLQNTGGGPGPSITIDPTLSIAGAAADAKAVGDKMVWKPEDYVEGELLVFDADGNLISSGLNHDNVAQQDGYYAGSGLGAATAENLIDTKNPGVLREFTKDTTAGDASVSDVGVATIKEIQGNTLRWNQKVGETKDFPETFAAYEKPVPAGEKAAEIGSIGGKTVVWNQLAKNGDFSDTSAWGGYSGASYSVNENVATVSFINSYSGIRQPFTFRKNHVYFVYGMGRVLTDGSLTSFRLGTNPYIEVMGFNDSSFTIIASIKTWSNEDYTDYFYIQKTNTGAATGEYKDIRIVDLTQLFGAGSEPQSTSDPRIAAIITYAEAHPEYDAGSLLSAKVTEVRSVGKNLLNPTNQRRGGYAVSVGSHLNIEDVAVNPLAVDADGKLSGTLATWQNTTFVCNVEPGATYSLRAKMEGTGIRFTRYWLTEDGTVLSNYNYIDEAADVTTRITAMANSTKFAITFTTQKAGQITAYASFVKSDALIPDFVPYMEDTLTIPAALRTFLADKGYGWSAGTAYNRIEYLAEPLTFVDATTGQMVTSSRIYRREVDKVYIDGTNVYPYNAWGETEYGYACYFRGGYAGFPNINKAMTNQAGMISDRFVPSGVGYRSMPLMTFVGSSGATEVYTFILPSNVTSGKQWFQDNPTTVYYRLGESIIYDISSYLPEDHTLSVEPGGILTFLQEDETQLQVPVTLNWTKDTWTEAIDSTHKYIFMSNSTKTYISGQSSVTIPSGQNKSLIDLTYMFGSGNEPATVAEFEKFFPLDWYAQNGGTVIGYNGTDIKTIGFNAFNLATGKAELLGGHQYEILGAYTSLSYSTGESIVPSDGKFTPTKNGTLTVTGGDDTTCIHLTWTGYRDGDYEAYWEQLREIPVSAYFPNGMHSIGDVHDSLYPDRAVQKIGYRDYEEGDEDDSSVVTDGAHTVYVLDTPVITPISPALNFTLRVDDFGTEEALPVNDDEPTTTPLKAMIAYGIDFAREVSTIRENYIPKAANPVNGDLAAIDSEGKIYDSGISATEVAKKTGAFTPGNVVTTDADGKLIDGEVPASEILDKVDFSKMQHLTEAQKAIARVNIGAAAAKRTPASWAEFGALVEAGLASSFLEVGDQITVERATAITATITGSGANSPTVELQDFIEAIGEAAPAVYIFIYTANGWAYDGKLITLSDYGITVSGTPTIGQEIHVVESTTQETFDVMAVDGYDTPAEAGKTHAVSLLTHDVISYNEIPFDPAEALYAVDADTWPNGMPAGTYHITLDHACYDGSTAQDGVYEFTTTQLIPVGGKIRHNAIGLYQTSGYTQEQILNGKFTTYNADFSTLESNIATTLGSGGTSLGTTTASNPTYLVGSHINFSQRNIYGNNRWDLSSDRKYLQSKAKGAASGAIASWWYATGEFDMPVRSTKPGYLYGLDPAFVKVLGVVKKRTALPIADGYGYTDTEDLVWLASITEVFPTSTTNPVGQKNNNIAETSFGADGATIQQNCYPYWEGSTNDDRIKYQGATARYWWLRGPYPSYSSSVRYVYTSGALSSGGANGAGGVVPGLCITGNPPPPTE